MPFSADYESREPTRSHVDGLPGLTLLEFGSPWCGYCSAAQPLIHQALVAHPDLRHLKIQDARGRRLGRSYGVKLWPTLILTKDGKELFRAVRPREGAALFEVLARVKSLDSEQSQP